MLVGYFPGELISGYTRPRNQLSSIIQGPYIHPAICYQLNCSLKGEKINLFKKSDSIEKKQGGICNHFVRARCFLLYRPRKILSLTVTVWEIQRGHIFLNDTEGSQIMAPKNVVLNLFLVKSRTMLVRVQSKKICWSSTNEHCLT